MLAPAQQGGEVGALGLAQLDLRTFIGASFSFEAPTNN
jgi:hypothetical protein